MMVRPGRPAAPRAERWPWIWGAIAIVLLVAFAGMSIAYLHASAVAKCVNSALAVRDQLIGTLHDADVTRVSGQKSAETTKAKGLAIVAHAFTADEVNRGLRMYVDGEQQFKKTLDDYIVTSNRIHEAQLKTPLGKC